MAGESCKGLQKTLSLSLSLSLSSTTVLELQVVSKHPLEANLSGNSLERVPKYLFLNYYLVALNLSRNFMKVCYQKIKWIWGRAS